MNPITLMVVDDHELITLAVKQILASHPDVVFAGSAKTAKEALDKIDFLNPDVVLVDISLQDSTAFNLMEDALVAHPNLRFLVFSGSEKSEDIIRSFQNGACGYVLKSAGPDELVDAIRSVIREGHYSKGVVSEALISNLHRKKSEKPLKFLLSPREMEILKEIVRGKSNQEIADILAISKRTVEAHKSNMMRRLNFSTTAELVMYGVKLKLIEL